MTIDLTGYTDTDLEDLAEQVRTERIRRATIANSPRLVAEQVAAYQRAAGTHTDGEAWVQPTGYMDSYPAGSIVTHDGQTWVATQDGTAAVPGDDGWRLVPVDGQPVPWVAPHAGEEYPPGALVTYDGHTWRNDLGKPNGFQPGQPQSGWTQIA